MSTPPHLPSRPSSGRLLVLAPPGQGRAPLDLQQALGDPELRPCLLEGWEAPELERPEPGDALLFQAGAPLPGAPLRRLRHRQPALPILALAPEGMDPLPLLGAGVDEVVTAVGQVPQALARARARQEARNRASVPAAAPDAFDGLFPNLYDWIYVVGFAEDGTRTFETVNPPLHAASGFLNPDFTGRSPASCLSPGSAALVEGHLDRALAEGRPLQFEEAHRVGEELRTFQTTLTPIRNKWGRIHRIAGISRDITALKEAQAALGASEERLACALEGTQQGLWDWNLATGEVFRSQRWNAMLGYQPGEVAPTLEAGLTLTHPDDRTRLQEAIQAHMEGFLPRFQAEYRLRTRGGDWLWIFDAGKIVERDPEGRPLRVAGLCTDITERRRAEESLRALVGGVVHEMRNPAYGIVINLDALEATFGDEARFRPFIAALRESSERIASLMNDLRDYGEPRTLMPEPCLVRSLLEQARDSCAPLALERGCQVRLDLAEPGLVLPIHPRRMHQAFRNLLENALQHAPAASTVRVSGELQEKDGNPWWVLSVADQGPGFGPEALARAFEPFFTRRKGGTGLGLSIVKRVVEEHGGSVEAANVPGGGALLTLRLPSLRGRLDMERPAHA